MNEIVENWKSKAKNELDDTRTYLKSLKVNKNIDASVSQLHQEVFAKVDCLQCANCCKTTPAIVTRPDARRIAKHLGITSKAFIKKYLLEDFDGSLMINGVPCTFLNQDNTCQIYEVRPEACSAYPHTDQFGFNRRSKMNALNTIVCPATYEIVRRLKNIHPT